QRVAELQRTLASRDDIVEFAPEPITEVDVTLWRDDLLHRADRTFDQLERRRDDLTESDRGLAERVLASRSSLPALICEVLPDHPQAMQIRHHGGVHLGQMLIVNDDVFTIDFEGEPRRSLDERRRKAPAARDVAGLIRSIDYSATAALQRAVRSAPDEQGKIARALDSWRDASVNAFLVSYRNWLNDPRLWPPSPQDADRLLDFFLLEKAFYEVEY